MQTTLKTLSLIAIFTTFSFTPVDAFAQWRAGAYRYGYPGYADAGIGLTGGYYKGLYGNDWYYDYYDADGLADYDAYDGIGLYGERDADENIGYDYGSVYNPGGLNVESWDVESYDGYGYEDYY